MILVTGATGTVGTELVARLLGVGARVRVGLRSPQKGAALIEQGAEVVAFDFAQPQTYAPALAGVSKVFFLSPPSAFDSILETQFVAAMKAAQVQHVPARVLRLQFQALHHGIERNHVRRWPHRSQETVDDGQGQWQSDGEARTLAWPGFHIHTAAQGLDVALDHIHAHAAAGQVADLLGGGKAGLEDQVEDLLVRGVLAEDLIEHQSRSLLEALNPSAGVMN